MTGNTHTISELAQEFGVTTRTIRFYEEKGLISPLREGQKRLYSNSDRVRIKLILRGKRIGMTLQRVRRFHRHVRPRTQQRRATALTYRQREASAREPAAAKKDIDDMLAGLDEVQEPVRGIPGRRQSPQKTPKP